MTEQGCHDMQATDEYLNHHHFLSASCIALSFGSIVGQLAEWSVFANNHGLKTSQWTWHDTELTKTVMRSFLTSLFIIFVFLVPRLMNMLQKLGATSDSAFWMDYLLFHILPFFTVGFMLFAFARVSLACLSKEPEGDHEFETREEFLMRKGARAVCHSTDASYDEFGESIEMSQI